MMSTLTSESKRIEAARQFAVEAAQLAANTHCDNVIVLDVRGISPITDFFVIATGSSSRQMNAVAQEVAETAAKNGSSALSSSGLDSGWVLVDFMDVVVHLFSAESRLYYDLENLWGDARPVDWRAEQKVS